MDKDYAPLSASCVRALNDKLYDKRKIAALEIEKMVKEFAIVNNSGQIKRLLRVLGQDFALSQNPHARKGGLIGLAAISIALGKDTSFYTQELINPILGCLSDQDLRVRYYACESLYNVVKVCRGEVLPHFPPVFNALCKVAADPDQNIKSASELLDRLLKDIVTESPSFDLKGFIPLLRERIYTRDSFSRQFVISWISLLNTEPSLDLISYLPEILDGLFRILEDPNAEVKKMCETTLGEFLRIIKSDPTKVNFGQMINILINHAGKEKNDDLVQFIAITWIKEFVQLSGPAMLPHMSGIFTAILPCLAYDMESRTKTDIKETATAINHTLMKLIALQADQDTHPEKLRADDFANDIPHEMDLASVLEVLKVYLNANHFSIQTKVAVLNWIHDLYKKLPDKMVPYLNDLFPALQTTLSDNSDEVVQQCLVVIAEVISSPKNNTLENDSNSYYNKFVVSLLTTFSIDERLLKERGSFIIRQLCVLLNAEEIYRTLAEILLKEPNLKFVSNMVKHLNMILLTSSELYDLRNRLKDLTVKENRVLFLSLYKTWCHHPVATVALCLLTQNYKHACDLTNLFGNIEVTVDFLTEIDKLVQLIESPIFAYLRLRLLDVPCDKHLIGALYGLLMLLPQTEAFITLKTRLGCIPSLYLHQQEEGPINNYSDLPIDFKELLKHFQEVQEKHKEFKKSSRMKELSLRKKNEPISDT